MGKNSQLATINQKEAMVNALEACYGNTRLAAKVAKISVRTHYRWCNEDSNYNTRTNGIKDICLRDIKDDLIYSAMNKIKQGDSAVLSKMLGIFLKDISGEMKELSRYNNVPFKMKIKIAPHPDDMFAKDPMTQLAVKRYFGDKVKGGKLGELRQNLVKKYKEGTIGVGEKGE